MMRGRGADEGPAMLRLPYRLLFVAGMAVLMATGWYALDHEGRICDILLFENECIKVWLYRLLYDNVFFLYTIVYI